MNMEEVLIVVADGSLKDKLYELPKHEFFNENTEEWEEEKGEFYFDPARKIKSIQDVIDLIECLEEKSITREELKKSFSDKCIDMNLIKIDKKNSVLYKTIEAFTRYVISEDSSSKELYENMLEASENFNFEIDSNNKVKVIDENVY